MKLLDLLRHLAAHNCALLREGANHSIYINRSNDQQTAVPRHREIGDNTCRAICKQLGIPFIR
ncbi:addiction module toxin, HicA family [Hymenobacter nivis]|uniref:Addiction module toxin, HicA family n=1 Tax=Hymenobacter nivis TaxID=1850093 RepID=A0A2Z3GVM1_9BACT|nr:addiction module toxin, HicA family [Hymenobacter nivis]